MLGEPGEEDVGRGPSAGEFGQPVLAIDQLDGLARGPVQPTVQVLLGAGGLAPLPPLGQVGQHVKVGADRGPVDWVDGSSGREPA